MALKTRTTHAPACRIPATSVADIAFLLVVFFALIANEPDRTQVVLPESNAQVAAAENAAIVVVGYEGEQLVLDEPVYKFSDGVTASEIVDGPTGLRGEAGRLLETDPARQFRLKADGRTPCRVIGGVLDALTRAGGTQVVMATTEKDPGGAP